jgi:hypothetical protein
VPKTSGRILYLHYVNWRKKKLCGGKTTVNTQQRTIIKTGVYKEYYLGQQNNLSKKGLP